MTPTELELARELARHPAWVWMDGMRVVPTRAADGVSPRRLCHEPWKHDGSLIAPPHGHVLDLADPATLGCLIAMLGDDVIWISNSTTVYDKDGSHQEWTVTRGRALERDGGRTLGEALARAWLEAQEGGKHG